MLGDNGGKKNTMEFTMEWRNVKCLENISKNEKTQIERSKENGILFSDVTETDGRPHFRRRPVTNSRL